MSMFSGGELSRMPLGWPARLFLAFAAVGVIAILALGGWALFAYCISHLRWV